MGVPPGIDGAGRGERRKRSAQRNAAIEIRQFPRRLPDAEKTCFPPAAIGNDPDGIAAKTAEMRVDDGNRAADGDRSLKRIAAGSQDRRTCLARQRMRACYHAAAPVCLSRGIPFCRCRHAIKSHSVYGL